MSTKALIAQNVVDYSSVINYPYTDQQVFAGKVNNDAFPDILLYSSTANTLHVVLSNAQASSLSFSYNNAWDITLSSGEVVWNVIDADNDGDVDLFTQKINGNNLDLFVRINNANAFGAAIPINNSAIPNANYTLGCFTLNNDPFLDIYWYNTSTGLLSYTALDNNFQSQTIHTLTSGNDSEAATHFLHGHFSQINALEELVFIKEITNGNLADYTVQLLVNNNGTLALGLNHNYIGSQHQAFFVGNFTNGDNWSDIAILPGDCCIYLLPNVQVTLLPISLSGNRV